MNQARTTQRGISLVEQLVGVAVAAVTAGTAVPALSDFTQRHRLDSATQLLRTDIQHARSAATASNEPVRLRVQNNDGGACYVVHTGPSQACDCLGGASPVCAEGAQVLSAKRLPASDGIHLTSNSPSMTFDGSWGTVTPTGTLQLRNQRGQTLKLVVNIMGRVRQCTTTPGLPGAVAC